MYRPPEHTHQAPDSRRQGYNNLDKFENYGLLEEILNRPCHLQKIIQILPQLFLPVRHMEARGLEPRKVERGVNRARGYGAGGTRVVVGSADRHDPVAVAVGVLEDGAGDVGPALDGAGTRAVRPLPRRFQDCGTVSIRQRSV